MESKKCVGEMIIDQKKRSVGVLWLWMERRTKTFAYKMEQTNNNWRAKKWVPRKHW